MTLRCLLCFFLFAFALAPYAHAEPSDRELILQLAQKVEQLEKELAELKQQQHIASAQSVQADATSAPVAASDAMGSNRTPPPPDEIEKSVEAALVQRNAVLMAPGTFEIEPGISYAHSSSDSVVVNGFSIFPVLVVGSVTSEEVRRDTLVGSLTGRAGLPWGSQIDVRVPYQYIMQQRNQASGTYISDDTYGLGDVSVGLSKELVTQDGAMPNLIGRVSWKTDTGDSIYDDDALGIGSGFNSIRSEVTALKVTDPAAFYATLGYVTNFEDTKSVGTIDLGDSFEASIGTTVALNREFAISLGVQNSWTMESKLNGVGVHGSDLNVSNLNVGMSYELLENRRLDISTSAGLTRDAPDYTLNVSMPFRF